MPATLLEDRGVLRLTGEQSPAFLQGLVTNDVENLPPGEARYAALLSPQGKILCDFFVFRPRDAQDGELLLDCPKDRLADLALRLNAYRLRARVAIDDVSSALAVVANWAPFDAPERFENGFADPRHPQAGQRSLVARPAPSFDASLDDYEERRIFLGLPKGGVDFLYGDAFPHEAGMDRLRGLDFRKGCYVGQEVVSRMQHRGTTRNRVLRVAYAGPAPAPATEIRGGETLLGVMGSSRHGHGLAMLRTDRVEEAASAGLPIQAGGIELRILPPVDSA